MTVRELINEVVAAWQSGDALRASAFFCSDGVYHESGREPVRGREEILAYFTRFFRDGPVWTFEIVDTVVEGDRAAVEYRFVLGSEAGRRTHEGCALVRREGGLIAQWREYHG